MPSIKEQYPIPYKTNMTIAAICTALLIMLQRNSSLTSNPWLFALEAVAFGILFIPVYSLIHEAEHGLALPGRKSNYWLGVFLSMLFMAPFTFIQKCHLNHHRHNRTDYEMWDLYYEHQNKFRRRIYLYIVMIGFEWLMLPLAVIIFAIYPRLAFSRFFTSLAEIKGVIEDVGKEKFLKRIRVESWGVIAFHASLIYFLHLNILHYSILYLVNGFICSSQNFVNHAFSPRDIINGAHNHKMSRWLKYVYLNFNIHLAHHQNTKVPWIHLQQFIKEDQHRISFWKAYVKLWKGPVLTNEPSPVKERTVDKMDEIATREKMHH